jgi:hypothetical protein
VGWTTPNNIGQVVTEFTVFLMLAIVVNLAILAYRLKSVLARTFPDAPKKGTTYYALIRALQIRFLRMPKPQVKVGDRSPELAAK